MNHSLESHFRIVLILMLLFFFTDMATATAYAFHWTPEKIGNGLARDAFLQCFGLAMGILRGMLPDDVRSNIHINNEETK